MFLLNVFLLSAYTLSIRSACIHYLDECKCSSLALTEIIPVEGSHMMQFLPKTADKAADYINEQKLSEK